MLGCLGLAGHLRSEGPGSWGAEIWMESWGLGEQRSEGGSQWQLPSLVDRQTLDTTGCCPSCRQRDRAPTSKCQPQRVATLFKHFSSKARSRGTLKYSERGLYPPPAPGQLLEARNSQLPQEIKVTKSPPPQAVLVSLLPHRHPALGGLSACPWTSWADAEGAAPHQKMIRGPSQRGTKSRVQELPRGP